MGNDDGLDVLRSVRMFAGLRDGDLRKVRRLCTEVNVPEGFMLTTQGKVGLECFIVQDGKAEVLIDGESVATIGPGECVGEMALLDKEPRSATVIARSPMKLLALTPSEFGALIADQPTVSREIMIALVRRLREVERAHA